MPFTVEDFQDLLRLLEQQPHWKSALRAALLGEEFLQLPVLVRDLVEAQRRTEEELRRLADAQRRTEERLERLEQAVAQLAEAQRRTEERLERLEQVVAQLAEAQRRTEETVRTLVREVGALKGETLERRYRERAASYFQRILRRIRVVDHQQLGLLLDDALDAGHISPEERADVLEADVVAVGLRDGEEVYLLAEVSGTVTAHDVRRARRRAEVLQRAVGRPVLSAVAGEVLSDDPETLAEAMQVWRVLDGRADPPV
ncbi:MAG: hypothetical protein QN193_02100 [Armatimonadota bacterium]|nr:hypothetical protein [Armatimonadota bacterium]MDR7443014.1 hypothetical protein [Armatimonadota bacterium]MDR7569382.1 hypothetical protein [Armatimonadota bacterium]MDR7614531.1 hypothetical protein [Armatimonadota bacterium]